MSRPKKKPGFDAEQILHDLIAVVTESYNSADDEEQEHKLREAANVRMTGFAPKVVELTATNFGFSKSESDSILNHLIDGGSLSLYGLSNAVTRASQDIESYDRATALESAGWEIVTMAPAMWSELNEKA